MNRKHERKTIAGHLVWLLCLAAVVLAVAAPTVAAQQSADSGRKPWIVSYAINRGIAGVTDRISLTDQGNVDVWSRFGGRACFRASETHLSEANALLNQLRLSGPPKQPDEKSPAAPDLPSDSFTATYGGTVYHLAAYGPADARKQLFAIISQLTDEGKKRMAQTKQQDPAASAPCSVAK